MYRVWFPFTAAVVFGSATVALGFVAPTTAVAAPGALAAGTAAVYCYRRALRRAREAPYRRVDVERNEDGTVGTPGPEVDPSPGGGVEHDPFEDDPESFAFDGEFWRDADVGPDADAGPGGPIGSRRWIGTRDPGGAVTVDPRTREACEILGVEPGADAGTLRRAYRERAKETHPDNGGDPEAFKRVRWAYEHLAERAPDAESGAEAA